MNMKRTIRTLLLPVMLLTATVSRAEVSYVATNPLEWVALAGGYELLEDGIHKEMGTQTQTALLQNSIAAEFTQMKKWEGKYNSYLKTASGYASSLKACTCLYNEGVRMILNLAQLRRAIRSNPQGIIASMSMDNLYIETVTELVSTYNLLQEAIATGGSRNMLDGAERSQILWMLEDRLGSFNRKLSTLILSIRYYTLTDVWNNATAGMLDKSNGQLADEAFDRWRRRMTATDI